MSGRASHPVAQRRAAARLRGRLPRRKPAGRPAPARGRHQHHAGDPRRVDTYLKADISPSTCFIVEDNGRRSSRKSCPRFATPAARSSTRCTPGRGEERRTELRAEYPDLTHLELAELIRPTLVTELSRSMTRARVQQYQRYFADADKVLILLHNDPDPDALASGLALRNLLRRTKTTAIIGAIQGVTRPENLRMANMLDIHVETNHPGVVRRSSSASPRSTSSRTISAACSIARTSSSITIPSSPATARSSRTSAPTTARPAPS